MRFSVITVCRNDCNHIAFTLDSILNQKYKNYEIIICDGGSTDGTYDAVLSYKKKFEDLGIKFFSQSVEDGGIYYGMNYGIARASGEYCIFMNCGDRFHSKTALLKASRVINKENADVFYGDCITFDKENKFRYYTSVEKFRYKESICHQASFIKTSLLKERNYNTKYRSAADYEYWFYLLAKGSVFYHLNDIVADFRLGGISSNVAVALSESEYIFKKYGNLPICSDIPPDINHKKYVYNTKNVLTNLSNGWNGVRDEGAWSDQNESSFYFNLSARKNICLSIYVIDQNNYNNELYVNNMFVQKIEKRSGMHRFNIDKSLLVSGCNKFSIITKDTLQRYNVINPESIDLRYLNINIRMTAVIEII